MEPLSDEDLISRCLNRAGSSEAERWLAEVFQRYHARVALWCLRFTGDRESAADLAQEVFMKAFRNLSSFRAESKFSTWLYSITRNHCYNAIKARAASPEQIGDPLMDDFVDRTPGPHRQLERKGAAELLRELIHGSLTDIETQAITLHYVEELPLDAVTRLLKLENTSGAKAYIVSAKRKLARAAERWKAGEQRARP